MDKTNIDTIASLRQAVEKRMGRGVNSPSEFKRLKQEIERHTDRSISETTLMRIWGYQKSKVKPYASTLDTLAVYAGYHDFASFVSGTDSDGSAEVASPHLNVDEDLSPRDHVLLRWQPGSECLVRYMGDGQFVVERSERSKLAVGDTFTCHLIVQGHPLYLDNLVHQSMPPRCYVCGHTRGVKYEVIKVPEQG